MSRATLSATPYSGTFNPTSIAGCQLWLDGADASQVTYSTGSNISQWKDKSGNANHGSQSTAGQQPYYSTASNAVVFSGAQVMTCPLSASSTIETCFFVFSTTINKGVLIGAVTSPGRNIDFYDSYNMRIVQQYNALVLSSTYTFSPNTTVLATTQTTSTNSYIFMYGSQTNSNSTVANYGTGITSVIGTNGSDPPVEPFNGPMFEMIIFNTVLTTAQRQQVEGYLAWKWGTQASLPGGHLYASAAPTGASLRPALSAALAPTPVRALGKASYTGIFTPTSIAGCQMWLDAADATTFTISSGSNVSSWSDKSGSSSSLSNTTGNPPYFTTYNGYPTVSFRGSLSSTSNVLSNQTFSIAPANISIFIITQALQNGGSYIHPGILTIFPNPLSGVDYRDGLTIDGGNASSIIFEVYGGSGTITGASYSGSGLTPRGVYSIVNTSNVLYGYANGTQWGTNTFTFNTTNVGIALGMRHLGSLSVQNGASAFDGNISEVIIYNTGLTTTQRQQVEGYLAWKWGLQASLPPFAGPLSLSGCSLWLDAADSTTITGTTTVTAWTDKSGKGNNAAFDTNKPSYTPANKYVETSNNNTHIRLPAAAFTNITNQTCIIFIVYADKQTGTNNQGLFATTDYGLYQILRSPTYATPYIIRGNISVSDSDYTTFRNRLATTNTVLYSIQYTAGVVGSSNYVVSAYGNSWIASSANNSQQVTGDVYLGGITNFDIAGDIYANLKIYEVLVYNNILLTTAQRQQVEGYLAWKWGTQSQLPANHPNYSSSPFHAYAAATPIGANLRPAISQALVPAGVRGLAATRKLQSYTQAFSYTGANQTFVVPSTVTSLTVYMWGAGGGGGHTGTQGATAGGAGAYLEGTLTVAPNNSLTIIVGGGGAHGSVGVAYGGGGSAAGAAYGGGGGRSAIQLSGTELVDAGGGGGAGYDCSGGYANFSPTINGGAGYPGLTGASWPFDSGGGGTQTAGGAAGPGNASSYGTPQPGTYLAGGLAAAYAGAGGSGYYGGGGGNTNDTNGAGGGGGSSYTTNAAFTLITGSNSPNSGYSAPASASPYYVSGVAAGSTNMTTGGNGRIVLVYLA